MICLDYVWGVRNAGSSVAAAVAVLPVAPVDHRFDQQAHYFFDLHKQNYETRLTRINSRTVKYVFNVSRTKNLLERYFCIFTPIIHCYMYICSIVVGIVWCQ